MVHSNNFVVVIKSNGKVLREVNNEVTLPFGSEYTILLKNLDSRKAVAAVSIDGKDILDNTRIIVPANESVELKGEMGENKVRYKFKFIEKTEQISEYRGDRSDDGIIRIEVWFEQIYQSITWTTYPWTTYPLYSYEKKEWVNPNILIQPQWEYGAYHTDVNINNDTLINCCYSSNGCVIPQNQDGITVKGSDVKQDFSIGYTNILELQSTIITISLKGYKKEEKVTKPIFVSTQFICDTCGLNNKPINKYCQYCSRCGTRLS